MFYKGWPQVQNNRRDALLHSGLLVWLGELDFLDPFAQINPPERLTPEWSGVLQRILQLPLHPAGALLAKLYLNHHWNLKHRGKNTAFWWGYANEFAARPEMFCQTSQSTDPGLFCTGLKTFCFYILHWRGLSFYDKQPSEVWYLLSSKRQTAHWHLCRLVMDQVPFLSKAQLY